MENVNFVSQDDFSIYPRAHMQGAIADHTLRNMNSVLFETGSLEFGGAVVEGSEEGLGIPFDGSNTFFQGIYFRRFCKNGRAVGATNPTPRDNSEILLVLYGRVWVKASNTVTAGDKAVLSDSNEWVGGGGAAGDFELEGGTFLTSGDAGELVKVELTGGRRLTAIS